ncbi:flagellar biosynthesis anti-sigma factor FlgM [Paenibacillus alginolyticus]|uniref:flagellar biosynthesis anti-sigma factor FlgM n=1 Tax=Paenibacillus alginolyticus TaxID=59839 RepID=UPI0012B58ADA|nr:flagellar biosynthesis anti-sigma factor FlgM [Paenibacillus alginolyticus]
MKKNRGSAGVDGHTIESIVQEYGEETVIEEIRQQLADGTYKPSPVKRKDIPKSDGKNLFFRNSEGKFILHASQFGFGLYSIVTLFQQFDWFKMPRILNTLS